jgi:hypothetical protein
MEEVQQEPVKGTYLYCVVPASLAPQVKGLTGIEGGEVFALQGDGLAAIVSEVATREELRPERRLLSAHQDVLKRMNEMSSAVLPVSFGTIAESPEGVRGLLEHYGKEFSSQLKRVDGKVEMRVRVVYASEKPNVFEFLVASSPELRELRDRVAQSGRQASREDKIDLGQKMEAVLSAVREQATTKLEQGIGKLGEVRQNPPRNETELVSSAWLIPKTRQRDFEAAVEKARQLFPDSFSVQQSGPFPPYDFVELHIKQ